MNNEDQIRRRWNWPQMVVWSVLGLGAIAYLTLQGSGTSTSNSGSQQSSSPSGKVVFGTKFNQAKFVVQGKTNTFRPNQSLAFIAYLSDKAGATHLAQSIARVYPGGSESSVWSQEVPISNTNADALGNAIPFSVLQAAGITAPGMYIMRYYRGSAKLAEGRFKLTQ